MKTTRTNEPAAPTSKTETPTVVAPTTLQSTRELLPQILAAATDDEALKIAQPVAPGRPTKERTYEIVPSDLPLPKRRGLMHVFVVAARLRKPFKVADVQAVVPNKGVAFWIRQLAKDGYLREVTA